MKVIKENINEKLKVRRINDSIEPINEDSNLPKFHLIYTVDGNRSEQTISAVNVQKAMELVKGQFDGKNINFISKQEVKESYNALDDFDATHSIEKLNPGDKFKNRNGVEVEIIEPDKLGRIQFKIDGDVRSGSERSIQNMLYRNNYLRLKENLKEDVVQDGSPKNDTFIGLSNMIIKEINGEWETISNYNDLISLMRAEGQDDMINVISDIIDEENKHIGQLQKCLQIISPNVSEIDSGESEAINQLNASEDCINCVDDDFGENSGFDIYLT